MKCEDCKYHLQIDGTIFCVSRNHKRRDVRIDKEDAKRDIDCKWDDERSEENVRKSD